MKSNIFPAIKLTLICLVFFCGIYPLMIFGIAQLTPNKGNGELIHSNEKSYYSNIAQNFNDDKYFSSRPSAAGYNAAGSCGSNKGPTNPDYLAEVQTRIDTFLVHNPGVANSEIPADLVTASGSGLDPNISIEAAMVQSKRIALIRNISQQEAIQLIEQHKEKALWGLFGPQKINVLKLNLALDEANIN